MNEHPTRAEASEPTATAQPRPRWRAVPFHPVLVAAFPVLALYAANIGQVPFAQAVRPLLISVAATTVLWAVVGRAMRSCTRSAAVASAGALAFFSYGHARNLAPPPLEDLVAPVLAASVVAVTLALWRRRDEFRRPTTALNLGSLVLVAPACSAIAGSIVAVPAQRYIQSRPAPGAPAAPIAVGTGAERARAVLRPRSLTVSERRALPDIYVIVLDAYGRADSLELFFGHDNSSFIRELQRRGFYVADRSTANYNQTGLCMASELNMAYLDDLARSMPPNSRDPEPQRQMVDDNAVVAHLRPLGYRFVGVGTDGPTRLEKADLVMKPQAAISSFEGEVLGVSALDVARSTRARLADQLRHRTRWTFDAIARAARLPYRKLVLVHVMAPHPPFVLGPNGEAAPSDPRFTYDDGTDLLAYISPEQYRRGYVGQLQYVNRRALAAVDAILASSRRPPIIVVQGDHGSRMSLDWQKVENTDLRGPFCILNAYHVPQAVRRRLYPTISPVNTFRVILAGAFGAACETLPDRSYYSTAMRPYVFTDVTNALARASGPPHIPDVPRFDYIPPQANVADPR